MENNFNYNSDAIGIGAIFPIRVTQNESGQTGWYPVEGDVALIEDNIKALLLYELGQRLRQEDFGTRLTEVLEEPNTSALSFLVRKFIMMALNRYESRVKINRIRTTRLTASLNILIEFTIRGINKDSSIEANYNL